MKKTLTILLFLIIIGKSQFHIKTVIEESNLYEYLQRIGMVRSDNRNFGEVPS